MMEAPKYSLQLRLVKGSGEDLSEHKVELTALPEGPGEFPQPHFELWEPLSTRLSTIASSSPFHLKAIYRTLSAGLTTSLINRDTGAKLFFSLSELKDLGVAS
jgi:hypothetical protein